MIDANKTLLQKELLALAAYEKNNEQIRRHYRSAILSTLLIAIATLAIIYWASWAEINQVAHTRGSFIASERNQIIQSARAGVIDELYVKEGQIVKKNQLLAILDKSSEEAAFNDTKAKMMAAEIALARYRSEMFGTPLSFSEDMLAYPEFVNNQKELFKRRKDLLEAEVSAYYNRLKLVREELGILEKLSLTGDVGKSDILQLKKQQSELEGNINSAKNKYFKEAQTEMTKMEETLSEHRNALVEKTTNVGRTEILSPVNGMVKNIWVSTKNASVQAAEKILEIVPEDQLILEVKLKPEDIAYVLLNLPVSVKLDAFDYTIYGDIKGVVSYISVDALLEKTNQGELPYYQVHIKIDSDSIEQRNANKSRKIVIQPGMTASADIETGYRTVLSYLTKPITKTLTESMTER